MYFLTASRKASRDAGMERTVSFPEFFTISVPCAASRAIRITGVVLSARHGWSGCVVISSVTIQNKVIFYNLSEIGQNAGSNRVVGGFTEDFSGHLAGRVHFSDDTHAQAFYDGGIAFFSTKVLTSPELSQKVEIEQTTRP